MNKNNKRIYYFGLTQQDGNKDMKELLGSKGAHLAEMNNIGLPVPPGFTVTTTTCSEYFASGNQLPSGLKKELKHYLDMLQKETGKKFGDSANPLLLSVRSGAAISMPGMMDTILNIGINDKTVVGLGEMSGNIRFAKDAYRRLIDMYGSVVNGINHSHFEAMFKKIKSRYKVGNDTDLNESGLDDLIKAYKTIYKKYCKRNFPQDPLIQLEHAVEAVFKSWHTPRAVTYRKINNINSLLGTAVNIQSMVFGNLDEDSGTGVAFTRNPATGENELYGEFLINAQGEDVVAGIRTPQPVQDMNSWSPGIYMQISKLKKKLENHLREMQDIEFTVERGKLYILQTRTGKRTISAAVRIAVDMVTEKLISKRTAITRIEAGEFNQLFLPSFDPSSKRNTLTRGLPASPGAATGYPVFSVDEATERAASGEKVILIRRETSPEDIQGMHVSEGILTSTGGSTSHAAVVARGWGKCCITGARDIIIDENKKYFKIGARFIKGTDVISIDGNTGEVFLGKVATLPPVLSREYNILMKWVDEIRNLEIRANADRPEDAINAREFGAQGIGLCRTEHMFFGKQRISAMQEMILASNPGNRRIALNKLLPYQRKDFIGILKAMKGLPVTIRLLDPPLHEFLPEDPRLQKKLARQMNIKFSELNERIQNLHEINPMLGHRGCRLTITFPEILEMQVTAITEALIECRRAKVQVYPEIMIPLIGHVTELIELRKLVEDTIESVKTRKKFRGKLEIPIGTMIEIPRAALTANEIAKHADFFSFGTNDLTQMTLGYSRDDIGTFMPEYLDKQIIENNPFQTLDINGVGQLIETAVKKGRSSKPGLKCGLCGEHGGDPDSLQFLHPIDLDYVSCSPFRIPVARLSAAQAVIND